MEATETRGDKGKRWRWKAEAGLKPERNVQPIEFVFVTGFVTGRDADKRKLWKRWRR